MKKFPSILLLLALLMGSGCPVTAARNLRTARHVVSAANFTSLNDAVAAIGSADARLTISTSMALTADLVVPGNVELYVVLGGYVTGAFTLQINGIVRAGTLRWIGTTTTVILNSITTAEPIWWATPGDIPGVDAMTSAVNKALASSAAVIQITLPYKVGSLTLTSNAVRRIQGWGRFIQAATGANILNISGVSEGLVIDGPSFEGVAGNALTASNSGIVIADSSRVTIKNSSFTGLRYHAVSVSCSTDVNILSNAFISNSSGIRLKGVDRFSVDNNYLGPPQYSGFTVAIGLDSGATNLDGTITRNKIKSWTNGQAILVHNGKRIIIANNPLDDVLTGISVNPYASGDVTDENTITGNPIHCTNTAGAGAGVQNVGISLAGASGYVITNTRITNNTISNANVIGDLSSQGGITAGYTDNAKITDNTIIAPVAAGIALNNPNTGIEILNNSVKGVVAASDTSQVGIISVSGSGTHTGKVRGNRIDGAAYGMRFNGSSPSLVIDDNDILNVTALYVNPGNVNFGITVLATTAPLDISAALAGGTQSSYTPTQTATLNAATIPQPNKPWQLVITTSGTSSFTITFGTNFKSQGVLTTGTTSGKVFTINFVSDSTGTNMVEVSRTPAM